MARVNFIYRSQKENGALKVRLQDKFEDSKGVSKFFQFEADTEIHTNKLFWNGELKKGLDKNGNKRSARDLDNYKQLPARKLSYQKISGTNLGNELREINEKTQKLTDFILKQYEAEKPNKEQKSWLKNIVKEYYTPEIEKKAYPIYLVDYIDYYVKERKELNDLRENTRKRINTTKNKIIRLEAEQKKSYKLKDVNEDFKSDFVGFSEKYKYSQNTQSGDFQRIKTICRNAAKKGIEVDQVIFDVDFKLKKAKSHKVYLTLEEVEAIKNIELEHDYLDNARDWLIISIYTGQRISDFMRFEAEMIETDQSGRSFVVFEQVKTGHDMYLPVVPELKQILNKRKGEFPRKISDQKYNDYIKIVAEKAGINSICKGKKRVCLVEDKDKATKYDYRDIEGDFEKWELVTSHIGRRTFATLNYGNIETPDLMYFTGHTTEKEFLNYIVRPDHEKAKRAYDSFQNKNHDQKQKPTFGVIRNEAVNQ